MESGDFSVSRQDDYYRKQFAEITDRGFVQRTFVSHAALVAKKTVNGHRMWRDYHGQAYDESEFDLVEGMWDHDHCNICWFRRSAVAEESEPESVVHDVHELQWN